MFDKILAGDWKFPSPYFDKISEDAKDLIRKLIELDPKKRLTAEKALEHKWIIAKSSTAHLPSTLEELKKFQAQRNWKVRPFFFYKFFFLIFFFSQKSINTVIAMNKFQFGLTRKKGQGSSAPSLGSIMQKLSLKDGKE